MCELYINMMKQAKIRYEMKILVRIYNDRATYCYPANKLAIFRHFDQTQSPLLPHT